MVRQSPGRLMCVAVWVASACGLVMVSAAFAETARSPFAVLVQGYEPPPPVEFHDIPKATPAPDELSPKDADRLKTLVPLLEGRQELWAMGEFVHYGTHSIPFLIDALAMPGVRLRYNAIETLSMIKDPAPVPALLDVAMNTDEISRIRTHAIRVARRLDWKQVLPAIRVMAKDDNSTIRKSAVYEARGVRDKDVLPILIETIGDAEKFVAITARDSFWRLTGFAGSNHDWETSTPEDRKEWGKEWWAWFKENESRFGPPDATRESSVPPTS